MTKEIKVLDKGFVRLDDSMATDLSVVNSARVSFAQSKSELDKSDDGLINFLMRERHGTPFEHNAFRFHVKTPIFVAREWFRHRIGSFNEWSARYSVIDPEWYVPQNIRTQVGKPGSYRFEPLGERERDKYMHIIDVTCEDSYSQYQKMLEQGVAKEVARMVLPVSMYTQFYWTVNARSLMNFLSLRSAETAQFEIREYSQTIEKIFSEKMPITYKYFVENGRIAP